MKPKPLDLEDFRKWRAKTNPDMIFSISQIEFIKQRIKSACEFYLRYKDKPYLLIKEYPKYEKEVKQFETSDGIAVDGEGFYYNKWLFKLAFKDVLGENEK